MPKEVSEGRRVKREDAAQEKMAKKEKDRQDRVAKKVCALSLPVALSVLNVCLILFIQESEKFTQCPRCAREMLRVEIFDHLRNEHAKGADPLT